MNVVGADARAEGGEEVVGESDGGAGERAAAKGKMCTELPGVEDINFFVGAVPVVVGAHGASGESAADVVHGSEAKIESEGAEASLFVRFAEAVGECPVVAEMLSEEVLLRPFGTD